MRLGAIARCDDAGLAAPLQPDHGPALVDATAKAGHHGIVGLGGKSLPFAVLDAQGTGGVVGEVHGVRLGLAVGDPQFPLMLGQRRSVGVLQAEGAGRPGRRGECRKSQDKGPEATHVI